MKSLYVTVAMAWLAFPATFASAESASTEALVAAAFEQTKHTLIYDGSYRRIAYPGGDVPADRGVCTDVIVRAYRAIGIDLQQRIHEDMRSNFAAYPKLWGLTKADANIDHRRVPNLQTYLERQHAQLRVTTNANDYRVGDLVTWMLPGNLPHIGIVAMQRSEQENRPLIVHNIGSGPKLEDMLFNYPITGHYRLVE
jgi:uncharacterized protein YijF (DUF1287 family)